MSTIPVFGFANAAGDMEINNIGKSNGNADPASETDAVGVSSFNFGPEIGAPLVDQSFDEDTSVSFTIPTDAFTDADGDLLTLSATLADGSAVPSWLSFNAVTGT
ncbi:putative Ig domain-containing protein [Roseibium sp. MMSF_3412]|uniref:putative Ig domain-containing protein n=1 Tax=Roseibium sp. MMSF_3412 TaxID=3046712 RepID=UPI00273DC597|nr:putative Ig domain-containing protein [Roseibium sp. MMSF_3412]